MSLPQVPVAILISGGGSNMVALAQSMDGAHPGRACLVLSNKPDVKGLERAAELGIATACVPSKGLTREAFEDQLDAELRKAGAEVLVLAGFMRVLTPGFIQRWQGRMLNIHPSLLPKYPGLHTHQRAIDAGDKEAGCSVHLVTEELDGGPVLAQARVPVLEGDSADSLAARVLVEEHRLYPEVLRRFLEIGSWRALR